MSTLEQIREERIAKIDILKKAGERPFAVSTARNISIKDFVENFEQLEKSQEEKIIAGRIMSRRGHGGIAFLDVYDGTGRVQALLRKDVLGETRMDLFNDAVDTGDFVEFSGVALITQRGEQSISVNS